MKKMLLKDGTTVEAPDEYGQRMIEQGQAVGFAPEKQAKAPKAEAEGQVMLRESERSDYGGSSAGVH